MSDETRTMDAGEYVLGTLSPEEREHFDGLLAVDDAARADVAFWENRLAVLNEALAPIEAPGGLWQKIEANLPPSNISSAAVTGGAMNDNMVAKLKSSRGRWRFAAVAATILAIAMGAYSMRDQLGIATDGLQNRQYIAVVNRDGSLPDLVIKVDGRTGEVSVRSVGLKQPEKDQSLELWYVPKDQKPISVGLVEEGVDNAIDNVEAEEGGLFAISLEPKGGSPTGVATGPVIYSGKLIPDIDSGE